MKKVLFLAAMAAVVMTGCSNDETLEQANGNAVQFRATVNNGTEGTRATSIDVANIKDFRVTGAYWNTFGTAGSAYLMSGVPVVRDAGGAKTDFKYAPTVYYSPNITSGDDFHFFAFSPAGSVNVTAGAAGAPAMTNTVAAANGVATAVLAYTVPLKDVAAAKMQEDLLVAYAASDGTASTAVGLTFDHALAKVTLAVKNTAAGTTLTVNSVKLMNMDNAGTLTMTSAPSIVWSANTDYASTYEMAIPVSGFAVQGNAAYEAQTTINEGLMVLPQLLATWTGTTVVAGDTPAANQAYIQINYEVTDASGAAIIPASDYKYKFGTLSELEYGHTYELQLQYSGYTVGFKVDDVNAWDDTDEDQPVN
jgi:hypothetical protein